MTTKVKIPKVEPEEITSQAFAEAIAPAVLDDLGSGVKVVPIGAPIPTWGVRVKGRLVSFHVGETWDVIIDRIREAWDRK